MKRRMKWIILAVLVALIAAAVLRSLSARQAQKAALEAQQAAQKIQVPVELAATDLVQANVTLRPSMKWKAAMCLCRSFSANDSSRPLSSRSISFQRWKSQVSM